LLVAVAASVHEWRTEDMTRLRLLAVGAVLALSSGSIAWADDDDDDWRGGRWQGRA
jgi:hypothetical protein